MASEPGGLPLIDVSKFVPSTAPPEKLIVTIVSSVDLADSVAVMVPVPPFSGIVIVAGPMFTVGKGLTTWDKGAEVLAAKFWVPRYAAVIGWVPAANVVVVKVATPALFNVLLPMRFVPSKKFTIPWSGLARDVTFAEKVTVWVNVLGLTVEVSIVEVLAWVTIWKTAAEVL